MKFASDHPWMTFFLALFGISAAAEVAIALRTGTRVSGASDPKRLPAGFNMPREVLMKLRDRAKADAHASFMRGVG
jgi:hypothetical protein